MTECTPNGHNLDVMHLGCCTSCGGNKIVDADRISTHLHTTSQVLKIAGEAWDAALSDQCDVNTYLTQLKSRLKK